MSTKNSGGPKHEAHHKQVAQHGHRNEKAHANVQPKAQPCIILSGFAGIGKSYFVSPTMREKVKADYPDLEFIDLDSVDYNWIDPNAQDKAKNPKFPHNYITKIREMLAPNRIILISAHKEVHDALSQADLKFILVYPQRSLKKEYEARYKTRKGQDPNLPAIMMKNWDLFIDRAEAQDCENIVLKTKQFLSDVMDTVLKMNP